VIHRCLGRGELSGKLVISSRPVFAPSRDISQSRFNDGFQSALLADFFHDVMGLLNFRANHIPIGLVALKIFDNRQSRYSMRLLPSIL
jgi:hypothetical protein